VYGKGTAWAFAIACSYCIPDSFITAQSESVQIRMTRTHSVELSERLRIGSLDGPADAFGEIRAVAFGRANRLYVADDLNHEIRVFESDGQLTRVIGRQGKGPGEFEWPWAVAVDDTDTLIVWDQGMGRFSVFDPDGEFQRSFPPPRSWLVNSIHFLPEGDLLIAAFGVTDTWGLHRLERDGEVINEFGAVSVDPNIYSGFVGSLFGGAADLTSGGDIVYTRKSPYELLFFDPQGEQLKTCVGDDDWTTAPHDVVEQHADRGVTLHWEQFVHSSRVFKLAGGRYLNVVHDLPNKRTILDVISADCMLLCRHALDDMLAVRDVKGDYLVATVQSDVPQIVVFEVSVHPLR
jgi:hypothetical protein